MSMAAGLLAFQPLLLFISMLLGVKVLGGLSRHSI